MQPFSSDDCKHHKQEKRRKRNSGGGGERREKLFGIEVKKGRMRELLKVQGDRKGARRGQGRG
eukprot:753200-Hanusia_phi.AAC.1